MTFVWEKGMDKQGKVKWLFSVLLTLDISELCLNFPTFDIEMVVSINIIPNQIYNCGLLLFYRREYNIE